MLTVFVNGVRIALSVYLYESGLHTQWLTTTRIHLILGIVIYVVCLYGNYMMASSLLNIAMFVKFDPGAAQGRSFQPAKHTGNSRVLVPMFWYGAVTLGVPILNGAYDKIGARFLIYAAFVTGVCAGICLIICGLRLFYWKFKSKVGILESS